VVHGRRKRRMRNQWAMETVGSGPCQEVMARGKIVLLRGFLLTLETENPGGTTAMSVEEFQVIKTLESRWLRRMPRPPCASPQETTSWQLKELTHAQPRKMRMRTPNQKDFQRWKGRRITG
jgi:hypothetical protein